MSPTSENITYEKIHFEKAKGKIERIFANSMVDKWELTPNDIGELADSTGIKLSWEEIEWWNLFEYGNKITMIKYGDITIVKFGDRYSTTFRKYLKPGK